jgi:hypothetical protein
VGRITDGCQRRLTEAAEEVRYHERALVVTIVDSVRLRRVLPDDTGACQAI